MAESISEEEIGIGPNGCSHARLELLFNAIENILTSAQVQTALSNAIDNVTAPRTLTAAQKRRVVLYWAKKQLDIT